MQGLHVDIDRAAPEIRIPTRADQRERHVQLVGEDVARLALGLEDLAHEHTIGPVLVEDLPPSPIHLVHLGLVDDSEGGVGAEHAADRVLDHRHVSEVFALEQGGRDVDAITVRPAVEPEPDDSFELRRHLWIPPVEVGLLGCEQVQVPLAAPLVLGPGGAAEG